MRFLGVRRLTRLSPHGRIKLNTSDDLHTLEYVEDYST